MSLRRLSLNQKQVQRCDLKGNYDGAFALWDETKEVPKKKKKKMLHDKTARISCERAGGKIIVDWD